MGGWGPFFCWAEAIGGTAKPPAPMALSWTAGSALADISAPATLDILESTALSLLFWGGLFVA